jgi:peptide/nickel transport system substrate-binding protein
MSAGGHELPSGTVTFLFTDIEGSTRLVKALGERYQGVLEEHQRILRSAFDEHHGREVDTQGDSFFVVFRRARHAVNAALAGQRELSAHDWPEGGVVKVRMGIHTGEPVVGEQRYSGMGVHRAARIAAVGHGGQILLSNATRELVEDDLPSGSSLRPLGRHRLKDIARPEAIFQLAAEGLPWKFPPLKTLGQTGWRRLGRTRTIAVAGAALAAAAAVVIVLVIVGGSGTARATSVAPNALGVIDAGGGGIAKQIAVGLAPGAVAATQDAVWVTNTDGNSVSRVDPATSSVRQTVAVGGGPVGVAVGGRAVWVANGLDGTVSRIDPGTNQVVRSIPVGAGPSAVAFGLGAVWVANSSDGTVSRIDPATWRVTRTLSAGLGAGGIAVGFGRVWVAAPAAGVVVVLDPRSGLVEDRIGVGVDPEKVAVGAGGVWVANRGDGTVSRIDPRSRTVTRTVDVGRGADSIAAGPDAVWVANPADRTLSRIDPGREAVVQTVSVGNPPQGLALSGKNLYVAVRATGGEHRGGTLRALIGYRPDSIDPAFAYLPASWSTLSMTNDGLVGFRRVGGIQGAQLVPDLAESLPTPTDGGRSYTFVIRRGIRYSNGRAVRPDDVRRALERVLRLNSPGGHYYRGILGAGGCTSSKSSCDLSRGIVTNDAARTITFHLAAADGEFLYKLALPFAFAVPVSTPLRDIGTRPVPATGPYRIARYVKGGESILLVRNQSFREWSSDAQPAGYPDRIWLRSDAQVQKRVSAAERGTADYTTDLAPFLSIAQLADIASRHPSRLRATTSSNTLFVFLNTRVAPFDDVLARTAVNLAVDRSEMARRVGSYGFVATCQVLPPNFASYRQTCLYGDGGPAGVERARALVRKSRTQGQRVVVWTPKALTALALGSYFVSVLHELGYRASLKSVAGGPPAYFGQVGDSRRRVQAGFYGWGADYPAPGGFLQALFGCADFTPASPETTTNVSEFCDPEVDAALAHAFDVQATDPPSATALFAGVERKILSRAPVVPLLNVRTVDLVSTRLGNYQFNPQYGFLLDQAWVR